MNYRLFFEKESGKKAYLKEGILNPNYVKWLENTLYKNMLCDIANTNGSKGLFQWLKKSK